MDLISEFFNASLRWLASMVLFFFIAIGVAALVTCIIWAATQTLNWWVFAAVSVVVFVVIFLFDRYYCSGGVEEAAM